MSLPADLSGCQNTRDSSRRHPPSSCHAHASMDTLAALDDSGLVELFVHQVIDTVCGQPAKFVALYAKTIPAERLEELIEALTAFVLRAAAAAWPKDKIAEAFQEAAQLPQPVCKAVGEAISARHTQLRAAALRRIAAFSGKSLADFDWKVNLAWSSSTLANLRQPVLQLELTLHDTLGTPQVVPVEFTLDELRLFIGTLEAANKTRLEIKV